MTIAVEDIGCLNPLLRSKILSLEHLGVIAGRARAEGQTVGLCHGVFDVLHLGHIRHIMAAKQQCDLVMVTLTADRYVNKGPGRPIFPEHIRAEVLAALEQVDYVAINDAPSAEPVLETIRPSVYFKGADYENPDDDITGKIRTERETVERHGGRLTFTRDITFSSSNIINKYLDVYDPPLRDFLDELRADDGLDGILTLINKVGGLKVLIVGDAIIDEYQYVNALGKAAKENMIATLFKEREIFAGGVLAAANHVAGFCESVEVVTALGAADSHEALIHDVLKPNVTLNPVMLKGRPTTRKSRFVETGYLRKLFEVYHMDDSPYDAEARAELEALVAKRARAADLVIVTDFGHGLLDSRLIRVLTENARFLAVNAQSNSGNHGFNLITKYHKADFICIDAPEARLAVAEKFASIPEIIENGLARRIDCPRIIVTHGAHGCYTYEAGKGLVHIPAFTKTVTDTIGAGDAFFVVAAPLVAAGGPMVQCGFVGNAAGAIKVGIVGPPTAGEKAPVVKLVTALRK